MTSQTPAPGRYPDPTAGPVPSGQPLSDKSKMVAGLLQIFLGGLGIGRFYLGYTTIGVLQIVVTIFTFGIGAIWPFVDGIMILLGKVPDAEGRVLRD
jgi:TM2 domain-containing membrane protein YozV